MVFNYRSEQNKASSLVFIQGVFSDLIDSPTRCRSEQWKRRLHKLHLVIIELQKLKRRPVHHDCVTCISPKMQPLRKRFSFSLKTNLFNHISKLVRINFNKSGFSTRQQIFAFFASNSLNITIIVQVTVYLQFQVWFKTRL